jgi:hypothetical protein
MRSIELLPRPFQALRHPHEAAGRSFPQLLRYPIEPLLAFVLTLIPGIEPALTLIRAQLPLVGDVLALVGHQFPAVGGPFPLVGYQLPLIGDAFPLASSPVALGHRPVPPGPVPAGERCTPAHRSAPARECGRPPPTTIVRRRQRGAPGAESRAGQRLAGGLGRAATRRLRLTAWSPRRS